MTIPPEHREFAALVAASRLQDPRPTFERLGEETGIAAADLMHHALVRWAAAGSEALLAIEPRVLDDLLEARRREDWDTVAGILDWLESGRGV